MCTLFLKKKKVYKRVRLEWPKSTKLNSETSLQDRQRKCQFPSVKAKKYYGNLRVILGKARELRLKQNYGFLIKKGRNFRQEEN